jgi:hypothetical protein
MQHLHRSTLWRRKQKSVSSKGRRRRCYGLRDSQDLEKLAKLLCAVAVTGHRNWNERRSVSIGEAMETHADDAVFDAALKKLKATASHEIGVGLLVVAAWDYFKPETRHRSGRRIPSGKDAAIKLKRLEDDAVRALISGDSKISEAQARKLVEEANPRGSGWVLEIVGGVAGSLEVNAVERSQRLACPSKHFGISRAMVSYYRRSSLYDEATRVAYGVVMLVERLIKT